MQLTVPSVYPSGRRAMLRGLGMSCPGDPGCPGYGGDPVDYSTVDPGTSSGGTDWSSVLNAITQGSFDIAKLLSVQPGTTLTPGGGISMQQTGYPILTGGSVGGISTTSLMLIAGVALVVILAVKK